MALPDFANISMKRVMLFIGLLGLTGCSTLPGVQWLSRFSFISPYKMDIRQGNSLDADKIAQLKLGMTRAQVQFLMGTPLVSDIFHKDRWDYIYNFQHNGKSVETRRLVLYFDQDKLARIVKDLGTPAAATPAAVVPAAVAPAAVTPAAATPAAAAPAAAAPAAVTPAAATPAAATPAAVAPAPAAPAAAAPAVKG